MKVLVDANPIVRKRTGVGMYTASLLEAAARLDDKNIYLLTAFIFANRPYDEPIKAKNLHYRLIRFVPGKVMNLMLTLGIAPPIDLLAFTKADIALYTNFIYYPRLFTKKAITIIYDLVYILYPQYMENQRFTNYLRRMVPRAIKGSDHIVTISESTKSGMVEHYGIDPNKITVITPAVDHASYFPAPAKETSDIKSKYKIKKDYLLYMGTIEPRKNIESILMAYMALPASIKQKYVLVLAGGKGWKYEAIQELIQEGGDSVLELGYVPDEDRRALYSGATVFLYPSHYEGWGMQIVEAMACGTPVITAINSSLQEAGGKAAIYLKENTADELRSAITMLVDNPDRRAEMTQKGLSHAKKFTWQKSAQQLLDLMKKVTND